MLLLLGVILKACCCRIGPRDLRLRANKHGRIIYKMSKDGTPIPKADSISKLSKRERKLIDGEIIVKNSNVTGYDLNFPDGRELWTKDIIAEYICDGAFTERPHKAYSEMFDTPGFVISFVVGLLITAVITTTVPMILSIKEEQRFTNRHDRRALKKEEKEMKEQQAEKNTKDAEKGVEEVEMDESEIYKIKDMKKRRCLDKLNIFSNAWALVGTALTLVLSVFLADMLLANYDTKHMFKQVNVGECYTLNVDNLDYGERDELEPVFPLDEDNAEMDAYDMEKATVSAVIGDNILFRISCGSSLYQPSSGLKWEFRSRYTESCTPTRARRYRYGEKFIKYGCPGGASKQKIEMDSTKPTEAGYNFTESFGYSCQKKACGCSNPCFTCNQWVCADAFFDVQEEEGWENCSLRDNMDVLIERNGKKMNSALNMALTSSNDPRTNWIYGWLRKDPALIIKTADYSDGVKTPLYTGTIPTKEWIQKYFTSGSDAVSLTVNQPPDLATSPEVPECYHLIAIDKSIAGDLVEFTDWCDNVHADFDTSGRVLLSTTSEKTCSVMITVKTNTNNMTANSKIDEDEGDGFVESVVRLSKGSVGRYFGVTKWRCNTISNEFGVTGSDGRFCSYDIEPEVFNASFYNDILTTVVQNKFASDSRTSSKSGVRVDLDSAKEAVKKLKCILAVVGAIAGVGALAYLIYFLYQRDMLCFKACKAKMAEKRLKKQGCLDPINGVAAGGTNINVIMTAPNTPGQP